MMMHRPTNHHKSWQKQWLLLLLMILLVSSSFTCCYAKTVSGTARLSGAQPEHLLTKFALSAYAKGKLDVSFSCTDMYENETFLRVHLYTDVDWPKVRKATTCDDKVRYAHRSSGNTGSFRIEFDYHRDEENNNDKEEWTYRLTIPLNQEESKRPHYWYVVMDDCSLERYNHDGKIPKINYELRIWNDVGGSDKIQGDDGNNEGEKAMILTHLSADENGMQKLYAISLVISVLLTFLMGIRIGTKIMESGTVHAALFVVMAASACNAASCLSELLHLKLYESNGYGSYTLDAMSCHFEAICDSLVALLLLSIAAGWTLPSDVLMAVPSSSQQASSGRLSSLVQGLRSPAGSLLTLGKGTTTPAAWLALVIIAAHVILAQWGRIYDDDFDSYHALEHVPGRTLMMFRVVLGLIFVVSCVQTASTCKGQLNLQKFYTKLAVVGTIWFQSLPAVTWICSWMVPYYLRHQAVHTVATVLQCASLVALAWLVTAHSNASPYHKVSRLVEGGDDNLTDQLASSSGGGSGFVGAGSSNTSGGAGRYHAAAAPKTWRFGKTKIRLD